MEFVLVETVLVGDPLYNQDRVYKDFKLKFHNLNDSTYGAEQTQSHFLYLADAASSVLLGLSDHFLCYF